MKIKIEFATSNEGEAEVEVINSDGKHIGTLLVSEWFTKAGSHGLYADVEAPAGGTLSSEKESHGPNVVVAFPPESK